GGRLQLLGSVNPSRGLKEQGCCDSSGTGRAIQSEPQPDIHKDKRVETNGELSTRTIEGAFSLFKHGVIGSYRHPGKNDLASYPQEFCWRTIAGRCTHPMFSTLTRSWLLRSPKLVED